MPSPLWIRHRSAIAAGKVQKAYGNAKEDMKARAKSSTRDRHIERHAR
ncbi:MAG: hypothetical protein U1F39_05385 [Steroidobacteraceae bacterium]